MGESDSQLIGFFDLVILLGRLPTLSVFYSNLFDLKLKKNNIFEVLI